jgi:ferritin-like protein
MSYHSEMVIQHLVESRKHESIRVHNQYINAMELRNGNDRRTKELVKTILSDLPEEEQVISHNFD